MNKELIELLKEAYNAGIIYEDSKGEQMCWTEFLDTIKNKQLNLCIVNCQREQLKDKKIITLEEYTKFIYKKERNKYINKETQMIASKESISKRYYWHLKNL